MSILLIILTPIFKFTYLKYFLKIFLSFVATAGVKVEQSLNLGHAATIFHIWYPWHKAIGTTMEHCAVEGQESNSMIKDASYNLRMMTINQYTYTYRYICQKFCRIQLIHMLHNRGKKDGNDMSFCCICLVRI